MLDPSPLGPDEVAAIDGAYTPIPSFAEWPQSVPSEERWNDVLAGMDAAREKASEDEVARAREATLRTAAVDTGAIEDLYDTDRGLTFTVAWQSAAWETRLQERGTRAVPLFKAQMHAFEHILDIATERRPLTEALIREIHSELTAPQETYEVHTPAGLQRQPLPRGKYKAYPNHVKGSDGDIVAYAPVSDTQPEMRKLVTEIESEQFASAHPVLQASYAHYALGRIHPFADGNGRVARALASVFTYREAGIPLVVFADERSDYFASLEAADAGDFTAFTSFISRAAVGSMVLFKDSIENALVGDLSETLEKLSAMSSGPGGLPHGKLDDAGNRLVSHIAERAPEKFDEFGQARGVTLTTNEEKTGTQSAPEGFRAVLGGKKGTAALLFKSAPPANATKKETVTAWISRGHYADGAFRLSAKDSRHHVDLDLREVHPRISNAASQRIDLFLQRVMTSNLEVLAGEAEKSLQKHGYRST